MKKVFFSIMIIISILFIYGILNNCFAISIPQSSSGFESTSTRTVNIVLTIIGYVLIWIPVIIIYFIPTIIACKYKHPHCIGIVLLNIFLGWSLLGWIGALIWSCIKGDKKNKENVYEELEQLMKLKESGAISEIEFEVEKSKILGK